MIRNPTVPAYRYDPYGKVLTSEAYDVETMKKIRLDAIQVARRSTTFGLILGTLGRQGSNHIFNRLRKILSANGKVVIPFLMAEINRAKLPMITEVDVWVQVACPRLSIDWGESFDKPIITPYELEVAMKETEWQDVYPMDYYSNDGGKWSNMPHR
jgi:2-(3-amino-3-carboxypropyl)histidine synthase